MLFIPFLHHSLQFKWRNTRKYATQGVRRLQFEFSPSPSCFVLSQISSHISMWRNFVSHYFLLWLPSGNFEIVGSTSKYERGNKSQGDAQFNSGHKVKVTIFQYNQCSYLYGAGFCVCIAARGFPDITEYKVGWNSIITTLNSICVVYTWLNLEPAYSQSYSILNYMFLLKQNQCYVVADTWLTVGSVLFVFLMQCIARCVLYLCL
jgi:hypothetical protein